MNNFTIEDFIKNPGFFDYFVNQKMRINCEDNSCNCEEFMLEKIKSLVKKVFAKMTEEAVWKTTFHYPNLIKYMDSEEHEMNRIADERRIKSGDLRYFQKKYSWLESDDINDIRRRKYNGTLGEGQMCVFRFLVYKGFTCNYRHTTEDLLYEPIWIRLLKNPHVSIQFGMFPETIPMKEISGDILIKY